MKPDAPVELPQPDTDDEYTIESLPARRPRPTNKKRTTRS
jgi:hypothetical protein